MAAMPSILTAEIEHLNLKVGTLEVDLNEAGFGKVLLDGKSFPVEQMTITIVAGTMPRVVAVFNPIRHGNAPDNPTVVDG